MYEKCKKKNQLRKPAAYFKTKQFSEYNHDKLKPLTGIHYLDLGMTDNVKG